MDKILERYILENFYVVGANLRKFYGIRGTFWQNKKLWKHFVEILKHFQENFRKIKKIIENFRNIVKSCKN